MSPGNYGIVGIHSCCYGAEGEFSSGLFVLYQHIYVTKTHIPAVPKYVPRIRFCNGHFKVNYFSIKGVMFC